MMGTRGKKDRIEKQKVLRISETTELLPDGPRND